MSYIDPQTVVSPKSWVKSVEVLYNDGPGSWSAAVLDCVEEDSGVRISKEHVGIRWNGSEDEKGMGAPQSRATPIWFLVPSELEQLVRQKAEELASKQDGSLISRYREMANDQEREKEAEEWSEGLIGDGTATDKKG